MKLIMCATKFGICRTWYLLISPRQRFPKFMPLAMPASKYVVSLRFGEKEFVGEGPTQQAAKHDAAAKALEEIVDVEEATPSISNGIKIEGISGRLKMGQPVYQVASHSIKRYP